MIAAVDLVGCGDEAMCNIQAGEGVANAWGIPRWRSITAMGICGRYRARMRFRAWRSHLLSASCILVAGLIALWNVIASFAIDRGSRPAGDPALDELLVRDVWTSHFPLVGSYSLFGWNHPGVWFHYLASIPYEVTGGGSWTLKLTAWSNRLPQRRALRVRVPVGRSANTAPWGLTRERQSWCFGRSRPQVRSV